MLKLRIRFTDGCAGVFLWLAGPFFASWLTPNLMEQASIWCFFSIAQIAIMLFIIREHLVKTWGRKPKPIEETKPAAKKTKAK
jgi:hypothetical protein